MDRLIPQILQRIFLSLQSLTVLIWLAVSIPRISSSKADTYACTFPDFLQSSDLGMGNWTCKYGEGTIHRIEVLRGRLLIFISTNRSMSLVGQHSQTPMWTDKVEVKEKRCVRQFGPDTFVVENVEKRPNYQCIQFIQRSPWVIQLKLHQVIGNLTNDICKLEYSLDEYIWISLKGYSFSVAKCPFTGGYNFHQVEYSTRDHIKKLLCRNVDPPIRVESDCVEQDGVQFHFPYSRCIPEEMKSPHMICMASWTDVNGDGFALLRSANGDRHFHCLRIKYHKGQVKELYLYIDWVCYRETDLKSNNQLVGLFTPYVVFKQATKKTIPYPCTDERRKCSKDKLDCSDKGCMATCEHCLNTTSTRCEFNDDVIGNWDIRQTGQSVTTFQVDKHGLHYPHLGQLQCISFNNQRKARLRAILWGSYQNGCYPRFLCMHYDIPSTSVMRYRMGNVLKWPLDLRDESICDENHFVVAPNMTIPTDTYHVKPWLVAMRSSSSLPTMPCVLPGYLPRYTTFLRNDNRTGCITLRPDFAPMTISLAYTEQNGRGEQFHDTTFSVEKFHCVSALTYTSVVTLTHDNRKEVLCWIVIGDYTVVVIQTSACNDWTAKEILQGDRTHFPHLKFWLRLGEGGQQLIETCYHYYREEQAAWETGFEESIHVERQKAGNGAERAGVSRCVCIVSILYIVLYSLLTLQHIFPSVVVR